MDFLGYNEKMNERYANIKLRNALDSGNLQDLHEAFIAGANLKNWVLNWNSPPVSIALRHPTSCHILTKELLSRGASFSDLDEVGIPPLGWAFLGHTMGNNLQANQARIEVLKTFKQHQVWQNQITDKNGKSNSLLHLAALSNFTQGIDFLIQLGFSINQKNSEGQLPLHLTYNSPEAAGILMAAGADPDQPSLNGELIHKKVSKKGPDYLLEWQARSEAELLKHNLPSHSPVKVIAKRI